MADTLTQAATAGASALPAAEALLTDVKTFKTGWKTSEFYFTLLISLGSITASVAGLLPAKYAVIVGAFSVGCYNLSRGFAKS